MRWLILLVLGLVLLDTTSNWEQRRSGKFWNRHKKHPAHGKQKGPSLRQRFSLEWLKFKKHFRRTYDKEEEDKRYQIYQSKKKRIVEHNEKFQQGETSYKVNLNRFSDMQSGRVRSLMNGFKVPKNYGQRRTPYYGFSKGVSLFKEKIPELFDWREKDIVTPVRDQGPCASCWSITTIGSIEAQLAMRKNRQVSLSPQHLIDCSTTYGNDGCKGGMPDYAFEFIEDGGVVTESMYPYKAAQEKCKLRKRNTTVTTQASLMRGYTQLPSGDEYSLMKAIWKIGPVCAAIDASRWTFHSYQNGIYNDTKCSSETLDHAVLVVGFGTENGVDYWIVRNSWGKNWGENGYVRMIRNYKNQCGIATMASYPIIK